ncbi:MAG: hypothetical protein Q9160_006730 [Pyrenula sp. 1 TL-2023]
MVYDVKHKRKPITYGKPARNRDQIFGYANTHPTESSPANAGPRREPIHARPENVTNTVVLGVQSMDSGGSEEISARQNKKRTETTRKANVAKNATGPARAATPTKSSLFEVPSSDEDLYDPRRDDPRKRRKLTPASDTSRFGPTAAVSIEKPGVRITTSLGPQSAETQQDKVDKPSTHQRQPRNQKLNDRPRPSLKRPVKRNESHDPSPSLFRHPTSPISETDSELDMTSVVRMCIDSPARSSPEPPVTPKSDRSTKSMRFQGLMDRHGVNETPSRLSIRGLRLSSKEVSPSPPLGIAVSKQSPQQRRPTAARARARLVDTLSQSQHGVADPHVQSEDSMVNGESQAKRISEEQVEETLQTSDLPMNASENKLPAIKAPKITYAMQRSYLSDMVQDESLEPSLPSFSQSSDLGVPGKGGLGGSFSQDLELEFLSDDDDGGIGPGAIRSIHELRKAGGNARFESSVDTIFEDIESPAAGRRLVGLVQLCQKLADREFKRQFLDHDLDRRLTRCDASDNNVLGSALTMVAFLLLLSQTQPSLKTVERCMKRNMKIALLTLEEQRDIVEIAKDRRQNLSKAVRNDLRDFKEKFIASEVWSDRKPQKLAPFLLCLRAIESTIRRMRELGDFGPHIDPEVFRAIVKTLNTSIQSASDPDSGLVRSTAVSILESFTVGIERLDPEYVDALGRLTEPSTLINSLSSSDEGVTTPQTQELFLRFILNITNNNEDLCNTFAQPSLISTISDLVYTSFSTLSAQESGVAEASPQLNTVILSLGALINFAEWSKSVRRLMLTLQSSSRGKHSELFVDWLTSTFNANVGTFLEASSAAQSHAMVTFGYLSVLLTTLCLDAKVREHVRGRLPGSSLRGVFVAVEEFLKHMRKVEQDERMLEYDENEKANGSAKKKMSDFAERFQNIVRELRRAERL